MKLLALDMDGVINSNVLIKKWFNDKINELEKQGYTYLNNTIRKEARRQFDREFCTSEELVFPELAEHIMKIYKETDCNILWTSTWRKINRYKDDINIAKDMFNRRGLPGDKLIGYTPDFASQRFSQTSCRGAEIRSWLLNNTFGNIEKCAVIDDGGDAGIGLPTNAKFFQTDINYGITKEIRDAIITYLNE